MTNEAEAEVVMIAVDGCQMESHRSVCLERSPSFVNTLCCLTGLLQPQPD